MRPITRPHVTIIDRPCGSGKTTQFIQSFDHDKRYLVVTPLLSEVQRIIDHSAIEFREPERSSTAANKTEGLEQLLTEGVNVVTTHALFEDIAFLARRGLLDDYHIIVDEVLDVCRQVDGKSPRSFQRFYIEDGYATVDKDGRVKPTALWDAEYEVVKDTLSPTLYRLAKSGMLYVVEDTFFMWVLPEDLLRVGRSFTVYTYLADGSMLLAYLQKLGIPYVHDVDPEVDGRFREKARRLITLEPIPSLAKFRFSYTGQSSHKKLEGGDNQVSRALSKLRERRLRGIPEGHVLITCAKVNWYKNGNDDIQQRKPGCYASGSRMFTSAKWIANTTRGTNDHAHCSHMIYLYDQHMNPYVKRWLGLGWDRSADDRYALTELIQWIYRSRVRKGEPVTIFIPSKRMRDLLCGWLDTTIDEAAWPGALVKT